MIRIIILSFLLSSAIGSRAQEGIFMEMDTAASVGQAVVIDTSKHYYLRALIRDQDFFLRLDSNNINALIKRAMLKNQLGDYAGSNRDYDKILLQMPNSSEGYSNRGMNYMMMKNYPKALEDMTKALQLMPDAMGYKLRAVIKTYSKDYESALADLDSAVTIDPEYLDAYNTKASIWMRMGKLEEALEQYSIVLRIDPGFWASYTGRAEVKFMLKDYKGCIADNLKALELKPDCGSHQLYKELADSYEKLGDKNNARLNAQKAEVYKRK